MLTSVCGVEEQKNESLKDKIEDLRGRIGHCAEQTNNIVMFICGPKPVNKEEPAKPVECLKDEIESLSWLTDRLMKNIGIISKELGL